MAARPVLPARALAALQLALLAPGGAAAQGPASGPEWSLSVFTADASLENRGVFTLAFGPDEMVWVAASDGLRRYDGYHWRTFTTADGLPSDYVRCATVLSDGTLWVGTDRGAGVLRGERFDASVTAGPLVGKSVRRIVEDPLDGGLWFCCDRWPDTRVSAGLVRLRGDEWTLYTGDDGLPTDFVLDVCVTAAGERFVITRRGLAQLDDGRWRRPLEEAGLEGHDEVLWSIVESKRHGVVASASQRLFVRQGGSWRSVPTQYSNHVKLGVTTDGDVLCSTEGGGRLLRWDGASFAPLASGGEPWPGPDVQYLAQAPDGALWVAGLGSLVRWGRESQWTLHRDLPAPAAVDATGRPWFAGNGRVVALSGDRRIPFEAGPPVQPDPAGGTWMQLADGVGHWTFDPEDGGGHLEAHPAERIGLAAPVLAAVDGEGRAWVRGTTAGGGAALAHGLDDAWERLELPVACHRMGIAAVVPDPSGGVWCLLSEPSDESLRLIAARAGGDVREVALPGRYVEYHAPGLLVGRDGRVWLHGFYGLYGLDAARAEPRADDWQRFELPGTHVHWAGARADELWFAYHGLTGGAGGLVHLAQGRWTIHEESGNDVGVPGSRAPLFGEPGRVWIAGEPGLSGPRGVTLPPGLQLERAALTPDGALWVGGPRGSGIYRPDGVLPETLVEDTTIVAAVGEPLQLRVHGVEHLRPRSEYRVWRVARRVDDGPWGPFAGLERGTVTLPPLGVGDHTVALAVMDEGGDSDATPALVQVRVQPVPWQQRPWFWPVLGASLVASAVLAAVSLAAWTQVRGQAAQLEGAVAQRSSDLREQQEQLAIAVAGSRGGSWRVNLDPAEPDLLPSAIGLSDSSKALIGYGPDEFPSRLDAWQARIHPADLAAMKRTWYEHLEGRDENYDVQYRIRHRDGGWRWIHSRGRIVRDGEERPRMWTGIHWDVTERKAAEEELAASEQRFRLLAENVPGVIYLSLDDERWTKLYLNDAVEDLTGVPKEEFLEGRVSVADLYHPEDLPASRSAVQRALAARRPFHLTWRLRHASGEWRWVEEFGVGVHDGEGRLRHLEGFLTDVTDRVREEEQRRLIVQELNHRVKNTLATVLAISDRTQAGAGGAEEFARVFRGRIAALARVHEALAHRSWEGASLRELIDAALAPYRGSEGRVRVDGPDLTLPIHAVSTVAMALHELATNAAKYGSLSVPEGRVHIRLEAGTPDGQGLRASLSWRESQGPPVREPERRGFGTTLIEQGVVYELGGSVELSFEPSGLACAITFTV